jgi:hypothetical protein
VYVSIGVMTQLNIVCEKSFLEAERCVSLPISSIDERREEGGKVFHRSSLDEGRLDVR